MAIMHKKSESTFKFIQNRYTRLLRQELKCLPRRHQKQVFVNQLVILIFVLHFINIVYTAIFIQFKGSVRLFYAEGPI